MISDMMFTYQIPEVDGGIYDMLIMECAFKQNLLKEKLTLFSEEDAGCGIFQPTLTTQGLCHTFNGQTISEVWKNKDMKIIDEFEDTFRNITHRDEKFQGSGMAEGMYLHI